MNDGEFYGDCTNLTGEIVKGGVLIQSFMAKQPYLIGAGINFGTYKRKNSAIIIAEILEEGGTVLKSCAINSQKFADNSYHFFNLPCALKKDTRYFLKVFSENGRSGHSVTSRWGYRKHFDEIFYLDNDARRGELACYFKFSEQACEPEPEMQVRKAEVEYVKGLVSVIIPCYNSFEFVAKTLESLKNQTYNYLDIIVVDDCSQDVRLLEHIVSKYDCEFLRLDEHKGANGARNAGEKLADGEYLFFCDSDVLLVPTCIEKMIQKLHSNISAQWCYCNFTVGRQHRTFQDFNIVELKKRNLCCTMSLLKRSVFPEFREDLKRLQDWDLFLTLSEKGYKGVWINELLFHAEDRPGITKNSISWEEAVADLKKYHPTLGSIQ